MSLISSPTESDIDLRVTDTESENSEKIMSSESGTAKTPEKKEFKKRRKHKGDIARSSEKDDEEEDEESLLDKEIDATIQNCAEKNNLTPDSIKIILRKLVKNEHILALCKIREEEEERQKTSADDNGDDDEDDDCLPKLTRSKAKELNKVLLPIVPMKDPDKEVVSLIQEELHPDEEDDEYEPCEDDIQSDDDHNTTTSDIDSQPRTPATPYMFSEMDDESTQFTEDGLFKIPRIRNDSVSLTEEQENIARRTRSKLCLTTTAIETIESTFLPPDITTDMYDLDCDIDNEWKDFLNDFTQPFDINKDDDEDGDPEYIAIDAGPMDREELREVRVSRKELNELVAELLQMSGADESQNINNIDEFLPMFDGVTKTTVSNGNSENMSNSNNEDMITPPSTPINRNKILRSKKQRPVVSTSESTSNDGDDESNMNVTKINEQTRMKDNNMSQFEPNSISTPKVISTKTNLNETVEPETTYVEVPVEPMQPAPAIEILSNIPLSNSQPVLQLPVMYSNYDSPYQQISNFANSSVIYQNGVFYLQTPLSLNLNPIDNCVLNTVDNNILAVSNDTNYGVVSDTVNVPTAIHNNTTRTPIVIPAGIDENITNVITTHNNSTDSNHILDQNNLTDDSKNVIKRNIFDYLYTLDPIDETREIFHEKAIGFTIKQRNLLKQQMQIHIQLATQNFLQTNQHPTLHRNSSTYKDFLNELELHVTTTNSAFNVVNLKPAVVFCDKWLENFETESEENREYINFVRVENERDILLRQKGQYYIRKFHPKFLNAVIYSTIFMYPSFLPKIPFRSLIRSEIGAAEEGIIAFGLELFYEKITEELNKYKPLKKKKPTLLKVCEYIAKYLCTSRSSSLIYDKVLGKKKMTNDINPIKYYFLHGKSPPFIKRWQDVDETNILAPIEQEKGVLPYIWDEYIHSDEQFKGEALKRRRKKALAQLPKDNDNIANSNMDINGIIKIPELNSEIRWEVNYSNTESELDNNRIDFSQFNVYTSSAFAMVNSKFLDYSYKPIDTRANRSESINQEDTADLSISSIRNLTIADITPDKSAPKCFDKNLAYGDKLFKNILDAFNKNHRISYYDKISRNEFLQSVYNSTLTIDIYTSLMIDLKELPDIDIIRMPSEDSSNSCNEMNEFNKRTCNESHNSTPKKIPRPSIIKSSVNVADLASTFCSRVHQKLVELNCTEQYEEFENILINFNSTSGEIFTLYHDLENFFLPKYPELVDMLLQILLPTPSAAAEIGGFFENWLLTNKSSCVNKFSLYFEKQKNQIQSVYEQIQNLADRILITKEVIKAYILPLVKGNPVLYDWFLEVFSNDKISKGDRNRREALKSFNKILNGPEETITYEEIPLHKQIIPGESCKMKYMSEMVFNEHIFVLPAKLSSLVYKSLIRKVKAANYMSQTQGKSDVLVETLRKSSTNTENNESPMNDKTASCENSSVDISLMIPESDTESNCSNKKKSSVNNNQAGINNTPLGQNIQFKSPTILLSRVRLPINEETKKDEKILRTIKLITPKKLKILKQRKIRKSTSSSDTDESVVLSKRRKSRRVIKMDKLKTITQKSSISKARKNKSEKSSPKIVRKSAKLRGRPSKKTSDESPSTPKQQETNASPISDKQSEETTKSNRSQSAENQTSNTTIAAVVSVNQAQCESVSWTRDEDKVILQVKRSLTTEEDDVICDKIKERLQNRQLPDIINRYTFLMDVLKKMQK